MPTEETSNNAVAILLDYQQYLSDNLREGCGFIRLIKQDKENPNLWWESYFKPKEYEKYRFLYNLDCGLSITHNLHKLFNKHLLMGNIKTDEVARMAGEITRQTFGDMLFDPEVFEIKDIDAFANMALTTQDQLKIYLTNVASSGIREWSKAILTITQRSSNDAQSMQAAQPEGLIERARQKITGSRDI